jgi:hypothetical protein
VYPWVYPWRTIEMTRFPKSGRGRKWTVAELKALPRDWKGDALADGDGLLGVVRVSTDEALRVHFRYGYKRPPVSI